MSIAIVLSQNRSEVKCLRLSGFQETLADLDRFAILIDEIKEFMGIGQNVSFDEMMVPYSGRSKHTLKMKNKLIKEGFMWEVQAMLVFWNFLDNNAVCCQGRPYLLCL